MQLQDTSMTKIQLYAFSFAFFPFCTLAAPASSSVESSVELIAVENVVSDQKIQQRLSEIFLAVGSYENVQVKVKSGVVILSGEIDEKNQMDWLLNLASRMEGVVAVRNQMQDRPGEILDIAPAREEFISFNAAFMRHLPTILLALGVLGISILIFLLTTMGFRNILSNKISSPLLLNASAKILSIPVIFVGLYLALKISGLAGLALTVLGGTGLLGLALGFGLKNSFEDYFASILLSIKKPFRKSDWVKIGEFEGIVQKVTSRSTLIIDFSGNHVLMPNSLVYKSIVTNMTANPKMRCDFGFGLDYKDSIAEAQSLVLELLQNCHLVLKEPEPWVLVEKLAGSSVNLRVYFWINARELSTFKVTSYLLLEVKNLLLSNGFHFPDPQREVIFMNPLASESEEPILNAEHVKAAISMQPRVEEVRAEAFELNRQASEADLPEQGESVI